jgi:ankyrin repeat protein
VLLDAGANVNKPGGWSNSQPLENAAWAGFADAVKLLIENGADLDARAETGHTALWYAAITGRKDIVEIMLKAGAKPEDGMLTAMRDSARSPYFGRALPKREDYDAVTQLLKQYGAR